MSFLESLWMETLRKTQGDSELSWVFMKHVALEAPDYLVDGTGLQKR